MTGFSSIGFSPFAHLELYVLSLEIGILELLRQMSSTRNLREIRAISFAALNDFRLNVIYGSR